MSKAVIKIIKRSKEAVAEKVAVAPEGLGSRVPKNAEQAESEVASRTIITIKAWVGELRQKQRAEIECAQRLLSEVA